jgi:thioredoxin reductase
VCFLFAGRARVLILGTGITGVSAATQLRENGIHDVLVIEGADQVGGQLKQTMLGSYNVEMGAMWVHGVEGNPMYELVKEYNISTVMTDWDDYVVYGDDGQVLTDAYDEAYERFAVAIEKRDIYTKVHYRISLCLCFLRYTKQVKYAHVSIGECPTYNNNIFVLNLYSHLPLKV